MIIGCVAIASVTIIIVTILLCFKGVTFHKKMEVIPTKQSSATDRPIEMDEIEKKLNEANRINAENEHVPHDKESGYIPGSTAMDQAIKKIQDIFGPELPPDQEVDNG